MVFVVRLNEAGSPDVLGYDDVEAVQPAPGQVRLRHMALALKYAETCLRNDSYPIALPVPMGSEAFGPVKEWGAGVTQVHA